VNIANIEIPLDSVYLRFRTYAVKGRKKQAVKVHTLRSFSVLFYLLHASIMLDPLQRESFREYK